MSANSSIQVSEAALRYASALLDLAVDQKVLEQTETELLAFGKAIDEVSELKRLIASPSIKTDDKVAGITAAAGKIGLSKLVTNFLSVVAENRRANELSSIVRAFMDLSADHRGVTRAVVTSAHPLTAAQLKELNDLVAGVSGGEVSMNVEVDPALVAGFQLKIGSRLIDASVKTKLDRMNLAMKGA